MKPWLRYALTFGAASAVITLLFNWLDRNLEKPATNEDANYQGKIWLLHSGAFYDVDKKTKRYVYAAESLDVVAHEAGHAILDVYQPGFWSTPDLETASFHEAFRADDQGRGMAPRAGRRPEPRRDSVPSAAPAQEDPALRTRLREYLRRRGNADRQPALEASSQRPPRPPPLPGRVRRKRLSLLRHHARQGLFQ